ncbi:MAG: ABC transporter permease [Chitinivibrionia bacterium]|nr:ABC transporter permease [Chitinivibrionia bacterium]
MLKNHPTIRFILQRGIWYLLTFFVAVTINFFLPRFGADPIDLIMSKQKGATGKQAEDKRTAYMKEFGLVDQQKVAVTVNREIFVDGNNKPISYETLSKSGLLVEDTLTQLWNSTFSVTDFAALQNALKKLNEKKGLKLPDWIDVWGGCEEVEIDDEREDNYECLPAWGLEEILRKNLTASEILSLPGININMGVKVYSANANALSEKLGGFSLVSEAYLVKEKSGELNIYQYNGDTQKPRYVKIAGAGNKVDDGNVSFLIGNEVLYNKAENEQDESVLTMLIPIRRSLFGQYIQYLGMIARGDLGTSLVRYPQSVGNIVSSAVPWTIALQLPAILIGWFFGNTLGALAAYKRGLFDKILFPCALLTNSIPMFAIGMLLVYVFAEGLGIFPASGGYAIDVVPGFTIAFITSAAYYYILPFLSLFPIFASGQATGMRTMGIYELGTGYVKYAKTLGVSEGRILMYIFRNAMLPQLTGLALGLGTMIGGALITEMIFSYPGLGSALLSAVQTNDYPLIQGGALLVMITVLVANLTVDLLIGFFDPRVKAGLSGG